MNFRWWYPGTQQKVNHLAVVLCRQALCFRHSSTALSDQWQSPADHITRTCNNCQHAGEEQCKPLSAELQQQQLHWHQQRWHFAPSWSSQLNAALCRSLPACFAGSRHFSIKVSKFEADHPPKKLSKPAVLAAIKKIALQAGQQYDGRPLVGFSRPNVHAQGTSAGRLALGPFSDRYRFSLMPLTYVQAAVAYDMGRCAVFGPEFAANFHPSLYSSGDINTMQQYLQQTQSGMFAAAVQAASTDPSRDYHTHQARQLADAAVEAAASAVVGEIVDSHRQHGCTKLSSGAVYARVAQKLTEESRRSSLGNQKTMITHCRAYGSAPKAAVAVDMMRQALGRPAVNFPADVTAAGVPAMKAWLELNRRRLTVQQQAWQAKAAAMKSAGAVMDDQGTG